MENYKETDSSTTEGQTPSYLAEENVYISTGMFDVLVSRSVLT